MTQDSGMVAPIVTVTPSPALDRTFRVDRLDFGAVARVQDVREDPGGKGVNVCRVLNQFGWPTTALGFIGGKIGRRLEEELRRYGILTDFVSVGGETRVNLALTDGERELKVNEAGPPIDAAAVLIEKVRCHARRSRAVVLTGSLPPGTGERLYAELVEVVRQEGSWPVLDAEGAPLRLGVAARPFLVKPNLREAETLLGDHSPWRRTSVRPRDDSETEGSRSWSFPWGLRGLDGVSWPALDGQDSAYQDGEHDRGARFLDGIPAHGHPGGYKSGLFPS